MIKKRMRISTKPTKMTLRSKVDASELDLKSDAELRCDSSEQDLVELEIYGLVVGPHQGRPLLLMKDKVGSHILPVGLNELEAQILAFGSDRQDSPHGVSLAIQKTLGLKVEKALFTEVRGQRQVLKVHFTSEIKDKTSTVIECFAESSISFCLGTKAPIYASQKFIEQCRRTPLDLHLTQTPIFGRDKVPPHLVQ